MKNTDSMYAEKNSSTEKKFIEDNILKLPKIFKWFDQNVLHMNLLLQL